MKKKHESSSLVSKATTDVLVNFIIESLEAIKDCKFIIKCIDDESQGILDEDDLLDAIDSPLLINTHTITTYRSCCFSIYNGINYYMGTIVEYVNNVHNNLNKLSEMGVYLTDEWKKLLKTECGMIIGGLCHVLWHEFSMEYYLRQVEIEGKGADAEIDEIFYRYCDLHGVSAEETAKMIRDDKLEYKFKLQFFDQYPEHEEIFESLMGPYIVGINEEVLTLEMVLQLENGDITPADLCEKCEMLSNGTVDNLDVE